MKKYLFLLLMSFFLPTILLGQDIIVKKNGTILNVYNLEESSSSYYYSLKPNSEILKINKVDVFSIKKHSSTPDTSNNSHATSNMISQISEAATGIKTSICYDKSGRKIITAKSPDGHELNYVVLSEATKTLMVVKGKYREKEYVIPEHVKADGTIYTVTEIEAECFKKEFTIENIHFPKTLKKIGRNAFERCGLKTIILPEGLEEIDVRAFYMTGWKTYSIRGELHPVQEIYLPLSVKIIGTNCFLQCGTDLDRYQKCQAYFSKMPDFITEENCARFGISAAAVRTYTKKNFGITIKK